MGVKWRYVEKSMHQPLFPLLFHLPLIHFPYPFLIGAIPMTAFRAPPAFSGKRNTPAYYETVNKILAVLRPVSTLRVMAEHLNASGFLTPSGLPFTRERVATYLRNKSI